MVDLRKELVNRIVEDLRNKLPDSEVKMSHKDDGSLEVLIDGVEVLDVAKIQHMLEQFSTSPPKIS
ncbi:MAG TPA: hypothetical protein DGH68_02755 [Bacteroidetes bacterium]|nr:hypothetical protein [Bacteroidota bacterium]